MHHFGHILRLDLRHLLRDRSLWVFLMMPLILTPILRWGWSWLAGYFPKIAIWSPEVSILFALILALTPAILWGLPMLAEKTGDLWSVWQVSPIPLWQWLGMRLFTMTGLSMLFVLVLFTGAGTLNLNGKNLFSLALAISLIAPLCTLILLLLAKNQVAGLTIFKGLNVLIALPLVMQWVGIEGKWKLLLPVFGLYEWAASPSFTLFFKVLTVLVILGWSMLAFGIIHYRWLRMGRF